MGRLFGTDGVRGVANRDLTCELAMEIAKAAGTIIREEKSGRCRFVLGCDTRSSASMLSSAMSAGLCAVGCDVILLGVVPTPAVAYLTKRLGADAGIMLTASHNPYEYNGIKIIGGDGFKLTDAEEEAIEAMVLDKARPAALAKADEMGVVSTGYDSVELYIGHLRSTVSGNFGGMRVAIDCANGSACATAKQIFEGLGAQCVFLNCEPNGVNVNRGCGSMHVSALADYVKANAMDLGVAFDGDADRCLAVDSEGTLVDGDVLMAIFARRMMRAGTLKKNGVVATVMSNIGFFKYAQANHLEAVTTKVGDRYVLEKIIAGGYSLGGEQSGHIIFFDHMTTGDGQLSALQLLEALAREGRPLRELRQVMRVYPQVIVNAPASTAAKAALPHAKSIWDQIAAMEKELDGNGRVLVRPSGTEPLIRVMVEGPETERIREMARQIAEAIGRELAD
ncbi:MAG: phosphoglucosamine mutase [Oscillospiraceae bacterium]|nr:phosphoglucosamine mutase [Oscillospiraceae bacterium]